MKFIKNYRGYGIFDSGCGYLLIGDKDTPDYIQKPFCDTEQAETYIDGLCAGKPIECPTQDPEFHRHQNVTHSVSIYCSTTSCDQFYG